MSFDRESRMWAPLWLMCATVLLFPATTLAEAAPGSLEAEIEYIDALSNNGYPDFTAAVIEAAKKKWPDAGGVLESAQIRAQLSGGQQEEVAKQIAKRPDQNSLDTWLMKVELARSYYAYSKFKEADEIYSAFFKRFTKVPDSVKRSYVNAALIYIQMLGKLDRAKDCLPCYKLAMEQAPDEETQLFIRADYLKKTAVKIRADKFDPMLLRSMSHEEAKTYLKTLSGVGDKVADCILLFGASRFEAFPVDTWIKQAMCELYSTENNEKKIIQVSKEFLTKDTKTMVDGIRESAKQLKAEKDFENILTRFNGREEELKTKLLKAHEQILRSDFMSTGLLMGSIPWIATGVTEYKTGRKGFSATFKMLEEKKVSKKEHQKSKLKKLAGTLAFAFIPGIILSRLVTKGLSAKTANIIKNNAQNFNYTSGVSMSKTINAMKWAFTGFLAKLPSSRDKYELKDRSAREGATFVMFFGGDYLLNNILGRLSDAFLGTKIMDTDKFKGEKIGFFKSFALPVRRFKKINNLKNVSPEIIKRTRNTGAVLYWVSLITNMAVLGFSVPRFLNKFLRHSVQKDRQKAQAIVLIKS